MDQQKNAEKDGENSTETRKQLNTFFEDLFKKTEQEQQFELFYSQKAKELLEIDPDCIQTVTRQFQKSTFQQKDVIVQLLSHFKGVDHISFLQNYVSREAFLPRTGMRILDLFNKSDVIVESGVASRLLEYDSLAQRIRQAAVADMGRDALVQEFLACREKEREGIVAQLLDELGSQASGFLARIVDADKTAGERVLDMLEGYADDTGFCVLKSMHAQSSRKDIAKRMKKVARALKQKGIEVSLPAQEKKNDAVFQSAGLPDARAFASSVDAEGYRLVFIIKPVSTYESKIFDIIINDERGVHELEVLTALRKETTRFVQKLQEDKKADFMETDTAYCVALVKEASGISQSRGRIVPATMAQFQAHFADCLAEDRQPRIYDVVKADEVAALDPTPDTAALVDTADMAFWYVVTDEAKTCWEKIAELYNSKIVLSEQQKQEQIKAFASEALATFFTEQRKQVFKRRLEEFAYRSHTRGNHAPARTAVAAALNFAAPGHDPGQDPFCVKMIEQAFEIFQTAFEKNRQGQSGIAPGAKSPSVIV